MRISVVYAGRINDLNGASKVVQQFQINLDTFKQNGIMVNDVFALDEHLNNDDKKPNTLRVLFRLMNRLLRKTYLGSILSYYITINKNATKVIQKYLKANSHDDVVIFHELFSCYQYIKNSNHQKNKAKIIVVHHTNGEMWKMLYTDYPLMVDSKFSNHLNRMAGRILDSVSAVVLVSERSRETFCIENKNYAYKAITIANGIEPRIKSPNREFVSLKMITVGTICRRKNQIAIIHALQAIEDKSITLTLVGLGDQLSECIAYVKDNNMGQQVFFLGNRSDVPEILDKHNLFIMTSFDEGLPIAGIEALRSSLPLIITDVGGNSELINQNGVLIKPEENQIVNAINGLNGNPSLLQKMSDKSRELFERKYSSQVMIQKYSDLINKKI